MSHRLYSTALGHIVDPTAGKGDFTTIQTAITAASSGQTIFIRPGTYTENLTLKAGVNLAAYACDAYTPNVTILGTCTATFAGVCSMSGIRLKTNGSYLLAITGTLQTEVNFINCYLDIASTAIQINSSGGPTVRMLYTTGDITSNSAALFTMTQAGTIIYYWCDITNSGGTTTASTLSAGQFASRWSRTYHPIVASSTGVVTGHDSIFDTNALSAVAVAITGSAITHTFNFCFIASANQAGISIGAGSTVTITHITFKSTATNVTTGAGTLNYAFLAYVDTGNGNNVVTTNILTTH